MTEILCRLAQGAQGTWFFGSMDFIINSGFLSTQTWQQQTWRRTLSVTHRMIRRPDHSPWIDVEQGTSSSRAIRRVTRSVFKASLFVRLHVMGNSAMITHRNERTTPDNVWDGYNPELRIWPRQIQHLGPYLCCALPPRAGLSWAIIPQRFHQGTLAGHHVPSVSANIDIK